MKKVLVALTMLMFLGSVSVTAYAASTESCVVKTCQQDGKDKKESCHKDKKCCSGDKKDKCTKEKKAECAKNKKDCKKGDKKCCASEGK